MKVGCILFVFCIAIPETKNKTTIDMLQPIITDDIILIHNGGITDSIRDGKRRCDLCGITCFWCKESVLEREDYDALITEASKRGGDGIGILIYHIPTNKTKQYYINNSYENNKELLLDFITKSMQINSILFVSCRATPETELVSHINMLQPISNKNCILIHNGGITDSIRDEIGDYNYKTKIDSEMIIAAYRKHNNNMKQTMEFLSGSFAFVMLDIKKQKLYSVTSFNPLAHMYIKGYGYFLHSSLDVLKEVLSNICNVTRDGMNVWESWYHHYIEGYTIIETDLESGFQIKQKFEPRFLHPTWDSRKKIKTYQPKTFVCCSGGIDSSLTARILQLYDYDVTIVHFKYGQKSEECEEWAVNKLAKEFSMDLKIIDLNDLYNTIDDKGMLTDKSIDINTGGKLIKSTVAWCSSRNLIFTSILLGLAESFVLKHNHEKVYIAAGWAQLSESNGGYPDNSPYFANAINEIKNYGCITGSRIEFIPVMENITKSEMWKLGDSIKFPFEYTVSCDNPKMSWEYNSPLLCVECGSTKLSMIAADRAGIEDKRKFTSERIKMSEKMKMSSIEEIKKRLILPKEK